jgi:hypothetical protein
MVWLGDKWREKPMLIPVDQCPWGIMIGVILLNMAFFILTTILGQVKQVLFIPCFPMIQMPGFGVIMEQIIRVILLLKIMVLLQ